MSPRTAARRAPVALCAALFLFPLVGCQGRKVVARVNNAAITEDDLFQRTIRLTPNEYNDPYVSAVAAQSGMALDAGAVGLIKTVRENLLTKLAEQKKYVADDKNLDAYLAFLRRNPAVEREISSGRQTPEDLRRRVRMSWLEFQIGTDGARAEQKEMDAFFKEKKSDFVLPAVWTVQILGTQDKAAAEKALVQLKKDGNFKAAASAMNLPPEQQATAGREQDIPETQAATNPQIKTVIDAFSKLKPGDLTPQPITLSLPTPPGTAAANTPRTYIVGRLVRAQQKYEPTAQELRPILELAVVQQKQPQWQQHLAQELFKFTTESRIEINIKRYEPLRDALAVPPAPAAPPGFGAPGDMGAAPGGAPGGGMTSPGGAP